MDHKQAEERLTALDSLINILHDQVKNGPISSMEELMDKFSHFTGLAQSFEQEIEEYSKFLMSSASESYIPPMENLRRISIIQNGLMCTSDHLRVAGDMLGTNIMNQLVGRVLYKTVPKEARMN